MKRMLLFITVLAIAGTQVAWGDAPSTMNYQGVLTDNNGVVVPDNDYSLTFRLYDSDSGGTLLWEESQSVKVKSGRFDVILGKTMPMDTLKFDIPYWLAIKVGADPEMTERIELTSVAYSFFSKSVANSCGLANATKDASTDLGITYTPIVTRTITVPTDGYLVAYGTAETIFRHENGGDTQVEFGFTSTTYSFTEGSRLYRIPSNYPTEDYVAPVTVHDVIPVTAGTHTYHFTGVMFAGYATVYEVEFTLLFFATTYGGVGGSE